MTAPRWYPANTTEREMAWALSGGNVRRYFRAFQAADIYLPYRVARDDADRGVPAVTAVEAAARGEVLPRYDSGLIIRRPGDDEWREWPPGGPSETLLDAVSLGDGATIEVFTRADLFAATYPDAPKPVMLGMRWAREAYDDVQRFRPAEPTGRRLAYHAIYREQAGVGPPVGLMVADPRTGDGLIWNHRLRGWQYNPGAVARKTLALEQDDVSPVDRAEAERVALKITKGLEVLPDEETIRWIFGWKGEPPQGPE